MSRQKPHKKEKSSLRTIGEFSGIAIQMGATIYLGNLLGEWLDEEFQKTFLEDTLTMLAVFLSLYLVISKVIAFNK